ncbi:MAG: hypothetical protein AAB956_02405 [Patescibacteria group bacterium]
MPELNLESKIKKVPPRPESKLVDLKLKELEKEYEAITRDESEQRKTALAALLQTVADYLKEIYPTDWQYEAVKDFYQTVWREYKQVSQDEKDAYQQALVAADEAVQKSRSARVEANDDDIKPAGGSQT